MTTKIRNPHLPYDEARWRPTRPETCERKHSFETAEAAYNERDRIISRLDVYWCNQCEGWHIGKNECLPVEPQGTPAPITPPTQVIVMRTDEAEIADMKKQINCYKAQIFGLNQSSMRKSEVIKSLRSKIADMEARNGRINELIDQLKESANA